VSAVVPGVGTLAPLQIEAGAVVEMCLRPRSVARYGPANGPETHLNVPHHRPAALTEVDGRLPGWSVLGRALRRVDVPHHRPAALQEVLG